MYLLEYVFIMLVIRLIKILIDVDYCNIFLRLIVREPDGLCV